MQGVKLGKILPFRTDSEYKTFQASKPRLGLERKCKAILSRKSQVDFIPRADPCPLPGDGAEGNAEPLGHSEREAGWISKAR